MRYENYSWVSILRPASSTWSTARWPLTDKEIALRTVPCSNPGRPLLYIDVRPFNVEQKATFSFARPEFVNGAPVPGLFRILARRTNRRWSFAAVPYRQDWYGSTTKDSPSKRLFSLSCFLFTLTDTERSKDRRSLRSRRFNGDLCGKSPKFASGKFVWR